jgi:large subunit ribosomal protein L18
MSLLRKYSQQTRRRTLRVRNQLRAVSSLPRVSVFRSLKQLYAQVIDDKTHKTVASFSSIALKNHTGDKKTAAKAVGLELAKLAKAAGVQAVCFDRGAYRYHGRVQALCEGLREGGLQV